PSGKDGGLRGRRGRPPPSARRRPFRRTAGRVPRRRISETMAARARIQAGELPIAGARRERADAAANRVRILEAAVRVLAKRGAEATSIDAVAAEAGVGKGTIFRRFGDRSGLFQALLDEHLRAFQDAFMFGPPPLGPGAPPEDRLAAFLDGLLDLYDDQLEVTLALERDRWSAPIGGYLALLVHVESLI